jgi:hypothetical protein
MGRSGFSLDFLFVLNVFHQCFILHTSFVYRIQYLQLKCKQTLLLSAVGKNPTFRLMVLYNLNTKSTFVNSMMPKFCHLCTVFCAGSFINPPSSAWSLRIQTVAWVLSMVKATTAKKTKRIWSSAYLESTKFQQRLFVVSYILYNVHTYKSSTLIRA